MNLGKSLRFIEIGMILGFVLLVAGKLSFVYFPIEYETITTNLAAYMYGLLDGGGIVLLLYNIRIIRIFIRKVVHFAATYAEYGKLK